MTPQTITQLLPYLLSLIGPHIAAILNDPRPNRAWLRVLVIVLLILSGAALQLWQSGTWSWIGFLQASAVLLLGTTTTYTLLKNAWLGKLETATGNGLGALLDLGRGATDHPPDARLRNLKGLLDAGLISQDEFDQRRSKILGEV